MKTGKFNRYIFAVILILYIAGQLLIGTYQPVEKKFVFNAPADIDFLYYGAIINQIFNHFPPENPAFAGERLTQPFFQYYPAAILSWIFNPYNSIRILNVLYLVLFWLVLKHFFPGRHGLALIIIMAASIPAAKLNALGVDLIARGFTHAPFFILLTMTIFNDKPVVRIVSIFLAALINGYLMLIIIPYLLINVIWKRRRDDIYVLISAVGGFLLAGVFISSGVSEKPFHFIFSESFYFSPVEILKHAGVFLILLIFYQHRESAILLIIAVAFGSLIHYNPFFPIFLSYYAGGLLIAAGKPKIAGGNTVVAAACALLFIFFLTSAYAKYDPGRGNYFPRYDRRIDSAVSWIEKNTKKSDRFAVLNADGQDMALLMEKRPIFLGFIGHVSHLGLNWRDRYNAINHLFLAGKTPANIDYIFYGPVERKYYPEAFLPFRPAYRDAEVTIYMLK